MAGKKNVTADEQTKKDEQTKNTVEQGKTVEEKVTEEKIKAPDEKQEPEAEKKQNDAQTEEVKETQKKPEKRVVAWVYVGNENRLEVKLGEKDEDGVLVLWRNTVYRKLPECKAIEELKEKEVLKPIYA